MKIDVISLANKKAGSIELDDTVFGLEVRGDLLARAVNWQLAKRRSGDHKTKGRSEVSGRKGKPFAQKVADVRAKVHFVLLKCVVVVLLLARLFVTTVILCKRKFDA